MKKPLIIFLFQIIVIIVCAYSYGQQNAIDNHLYGISNINKDENEVIIADERISRLLKTKLAKDEKNPTIEGYRIQIYFASGNNSRKSVNEIRTKFLTMYPQIGAYEIWQSPNFKVRVGDYRTKLEAYKFYKEIKNEFPSSFIVKDNINLPKLD